MEYRLPKKERGVQKAALIPQSDLELAEIGGMRSFTAAAREGMAPYIKRGKEIRGIVEKPAHKRMEL